jgi:RNA polymerase sigma factor (sigma-70 family)
LLCAAVSDCARAHLFRKIDPQSVNDQIHEITVIVLEAIRGGVLRDPRRVMGFVRTIARRRVAAFVRDSIRVRRQVGQNGFVHQTSSSEPSPEAQACRSENLERVRRALQSLRVRDREILIRFYYREQDPKQICREMRLTQTQYRLFKSRAIAKCIDLTQEKRQVARLFTPPDRRVSRNA